MNIGFHDKAPVSAPLVSGLRSGESTALANAGDDEGPLEVREASFLDTLAGKRLRSIGVVNASGALIENPTYIKGQQFNEGGEVSRTEVYRITAVSAYQVFMTFVDAYGVVTPSTQFQRTDSAFWDPQHWQLTKSNEQDWRKGQRR